jgi:uncharacterized protein YcbK (DUF882 family)
MRPAAFATAMAFLAAAIAVTVAWADVAYVVQRGHTLEEIAHRYSVDPQAIINANPLIRDPQHLKAGDRLIIPGVEDPHAKVAGGARDVVHAFRLNEEFHVHMRDARGKLPATALRYFEQLMRQGEAPERRHAPDPKLLALINAVSNHFGGKPLEIVSGFRAYTPTQYTARSNHNLGRALDFRVRGVRNEELRDFCLTLANAGCGYYPNSTFVHVDTRDTKTYWVDLSRPGEPPQYEKAGMSGDHGTSDVPDMN